ncbi:MAG: twin-arginine translocation signal domain-containing protein, partial [Hyphomonadaceae bacterium]
MKDLRHTRRQFMATTGAVGIAAPIATAFGMQLAAFNSAASQSAGGYKALVCIFQLGGNDSNNTVLA